MKRLPQKWIVTLLLSATAILGGAPASAGWVGPQLAGAWEITGTPDPGGCGPSDTFVNVVTISADGSITNVDPVVGTGVGSSYRLGNKFVVGFFGFLSPAPGLTLRYEVQGTTTLVSPGTFSGRFRTIVTDPNGMIPDCIYEGAIGGTRLVPMPY